MRSAVSVLYFIILQILWIFRSIYENVLHGKNTKNTTSKKETTDEDSQNVLENERRHLIHLFTTTPNQDNGRPVCYMHVCEILTPNEEEMLRCACAKGAPTNATYFVNDNHKRFPPTSRISRADFTNAWMESFSLVI